MENGSNTALEVAKNSRFDVCLIDIGLPEMDGNTLAGHFRKHENTTNALLVAVTGYGQDSDREQSFAAGFDKHLVKPVELGNLLTIIQSRVG